MDQADLEGSGPKDQAALSRIVALIPAAGAERDLLKSFFAADFPHLLVQPQQPLNYASPASPVTAATAEERTMGMLCHLLAFAGHFIPMGHIIGPLVIWLIKKDESPFVDDQGKESLNFQITMTIAGIVAGILVLVIIGIILLPIIWITDIVLVIVATVKANQGIAYRYPFCLRLIK